MNATAVRINLTLALVILLILVGSVPTPGSTVRVVIQSTKDRKPVPDFVLKDGSGKTVTLKDYRGKVVRLDFWATECGGCKVEIPWFIRFEHTYKDAGLAVVGVSMDIWYESLKNAGEGWNRVKPFAQLNKVNYPILMGNDQAIGAFSLKSLPDTYLIDREGRIAAVYNDGLVDKDNVEANIKTLLR